MHPKENRISDVTRRRISDEMIRKKIYYHGRLNEAEFLSRLFDTASMRSNDKRYNNAYDDIVQHVVKNQDWAEDWLYSDPRINLSFCSDSKYIEFLELTVHPRVRTDQSEVASIVDIYNKHLVNDGFEIVHIDDISGSPVFKVRNRSKFSLTLTANKREIKKYLNSEYVNNKIDRIIKALETDTDLAIGGAKELLETTCKSILKQKGVVIEPNLTLLKMVKATSNCLNFAPKSVQNPEKAERAIKQILGGISSIVHGVSELRNEYGTGHGKESDFLSLEKKYAKLLVGVVSEIVIFYLTTNGETAELQE